MNQSKHKLLLILGVLLLSFSCNKGNFDPTLCEDCPELTTCYEGICDCDTTISDKFWDRCYEKYPARYVCLDPDTNFGMSLFILDSIYYRPDLNEYRYEMYSDEYESMIIFLVDLRTNPIRYDVRIESEVGYDSIFMNDYFTIMQHNGSDYKRTFRGKRFGTDSLELRMFLQNTETYIVDDTSRVLTFRRL